MAKKYLDDTGMSYFWGKLKDYFQAKLVSGTNIKTINNETLLGSGDISVTSTPTASTISEFDLSAHMNSTDMTSQEVSDFVASLDCATPATIVKAKPVQGSVTVTANTATNLTTTAPSDAANILGAPITSVSATGTVNNIDRLFPLDNTDVRVRSTTAQTITIWRLYIYL